MEKESLMKALKTTMYIMVAYLTIIGVMYLLLPGTFETALKVSLPDRGTAMLHGFGNLIMAFLIYTTASNLEVYGKLVRVFQVFALGETLIFIYQLISGMNTFAEVGPPTIIWAIFTVLLFVFGRKL
jgi:hypothetical protein